MSSILSEEDTIDMLAMYYRQDPLPVYRRPKRPYIQRKKQHIPPDIMVWAESQSPRLNDRTIDVLPETSAFPLSSPLPSTFNNLDDAQLRLVAQGLVLFVLQANEFYWHYLENMVQDKLHFYSLRKKFFKIFANFALHIYDLEDFVRAAENRAIIKNVREFCHHLEEKFGGDNPEELASRAMIDMSIGNLDLKNFSFLWQQDVNLVLECYYRKPIGGCDSMAQRVYATYISNKMTNIQNFHVHEHYVRTALEAIREHMPLEGRKKTELMMNVGHKHCVIRQALYLEAWRGFQYGDLVKLHFKDYNSRIEDTFIMLFHDTLNNLASIKAELVTFSERVFCDPMECGFLGNFNKEVVEAVRIANFERMWHGSRFLTMDNLLFGLSRSRIADKIQVFEQTWCGGPVVKEFNDTELLYYILRLSHDVATYLGPGEVLLEHVYLATMFASRVLPTKRLRTDFSKQLIEWSSVLEQEAVTDFLKESAATNHEMQSSGELSAKVLWEQFFSEQDVVPFTPTHLLKTLNAKFKKNFNPLQCCLNASNDQSMEMDTGDGDDGMPRLRGPDYCQLYCHYLFTLYDEPESD